MNVMWYDCVCICNLVTFFLFVELAFILASNKHLILRKETCAV
uniref:Uncharacterized protein n=1 Tax=Rhizophora mucronata TaxID=61149 RepID=A0A2P2PJD0_RHIMU